MKKDINIIKAELENIRERFPFFSLDIKEIKDKLKILELQTKIINNENRLIYLLQKKEGSYLFSMGLFFTAIISFFVSQSQVNRIISIIMLFIAIVLLIIIKIKRENKRIEALNNAISIYRKRGLNEEEIKKLIKNDVFFSKSSFLFF